MMVVCKDRLSGDPVHIDDVERGKYSSAACFDCQDYLVAKKGNRVASHFAHRSRDSDCQGESGLHRLAKHILSKEKSICLRHYPERDKHFTYKFNHAYVEFKIENYRVDCFLRDEELPPLAVEIKVTHPVDDEKIMMFRRNKIAAIEIDLSSIDRLASKQEIKTAVCQHHCNVSWLYSEKIDQHNKKRRDQIYKETGHYIELPKGIE